MLFELLLLSDMLKTPLSGTGKFTSFFGRKTKKETLINQTVKPKAIVPTIYDDYESLPQSFDLSITPKEASDAYLDAIEGIEITSLPFLGKR